MQAITKSLHWSQSNFDNFYQIAPTTAGTHNNITYYIIFEEREGEGEQVALLVPWPLTTAMIPNLLILIPNPLSLNPARPTP